MTEPKKGRPIGKKRLFDDGQVVTSKVEKIPGVRIAVDEGEIEAAKEVVHFWPRLGEGVGHDGGAAPYLNCAGQTAGGGVVTVAKGGGENEDGGRTHIKPSRSSSSKRLSSD